MSEFKEKPLYSIIIPTYNHAHYIRKCLDSVISQTFINWEAIVVNNYSDDNTIEIVESFNDERISLINFKNNGIIAASRNEGIRNALGKWICFLDSDDWWYPGKLENCLNYFESADIIFHDVDYYNRNGKIRRKIVQTRQLGNDVFEDLLLGSNALPNSSVVVRKELLEKVGLISEDPELIAVEDFDCWLRLAKVTNRFVYISKSLGGYWSGDTSISLSENQLKREMKLFEIHSKDLPLALQEEARKRFLYKIGRMEHKLGRYDSAISDYKEAFHCNKLIIKIKSIFFIVNIMIIKTLG